MQWVVRVHQRMEGGGGGGGERGLTVRLEVMLMKWHSTFKWLEADNQSDVAPEFRSSQASTLSPAINNTVPHLITVNRSRPCCTGRRRKKIKSAEERGGN